MKNLIGVGVKIFVNFNFTEKDEGGELVEWQFVIWGRTEETNFGHIFLQSYFKFVSLNETDLL